MSSGDAMFLFWGFGFIGFICLFFALSDFIIDGLTFISNLLKRAYWAYYKRKEAR